MLSHQLSHPQPISHILPFLLSLNSYYFAMAVVQSGKTTVILGLLINLGLVVLKFIVYLYSHLNLFFADAIDSLVDSFVIFLIVIFLQFNLSKKTLTYLNLDIMFFCQWCVILIFRVIIFLEQISDLVDPRPREAPLLLIIVSSVVLLFSIVLGILFVDEDDVVKFFISDEDKARNKLYKKQQGKTKKGKKFKLLPIFAEILDNVATTLFALLVGILLYFEVIVDYLYLIDDISNMLISLVMILLSSRGLWSLARKYENKSYFDRLYVLKQENSVGDENSNISNNARVDDLSNV